MSKISITPNASGTGVFTISSPATNTNRTLTLPDADGTVLTSVSDLTGLTGVPASGTALFSAKASSAGWDTLVSGAVMTFNAENFDVDGVYDSVTNYNFTAPATGVYMFWYSIYTAWNDPNNAFGIYKNNSVLSLQVHSAGYLTFAETVTGDHIQSATVIIPLNVSDTIQVRPLTDSDYYRGYSQWGGVRIS